MLFLGGFHSTILQFSTTGLPTPTPKDCQGYPRYIIKDYDTCDGIAATMKVTRKQLIEANPGLDCWYVPYNQYLCIPSDKSTNPSPPTSTCPLESRQYSLQSGDTCFAIAISYGISEDQLKSANNALNCQQIQPGLQLCIPPPQITTPTIKPPTCPTTASAYELQSGDSCITVSLKNNISVASLQISNPQLDCSKLVLGQVICIPISKPPVPTSSPLPSCGIGAISYTVKSGDTCSTIATSNGINIDRLQSVNPTMKCDQLAVGQLICIPLLCQNGEKSSPVKVGDTCEKIATSWKVTLDQLLKSNSGLDCKTLVAGQLICQPGTGTTTPTPTTSPVVCGKDAIQYSIKAGDTCYAIATKFTISVEKLQVANPSLKCDQLIMGQAVCIPSAVPSSTVSLTPTATPPPTCPSGTASYSVKSGDTCSTIATRNTITVEKLQSVNPNMKCEELALNQILCIPPQCQNNDKPYYVVSGDTCTKYMQSWMVNQAQLKMSNPGLDCDHLYVGQLICRPGGGTPTTTTTTATTVTSTSTPSVSCQKGTSQYSVQSGDTCYAIATKFAILVENLQAANPSLKCDQLMVGQVVCIPSAELPLTLLSQVILAAQLPLVIPSP
ncbi:hypothetical protein K7432_017553 [Basidiobolus ranarum]|uniref:LysM domain-containing protein n=1 Tax=Basidiobolus ranarum TaxID=34480 RepID=A0ABR2WD77_9FUNG